MIQGGAPGDPGDVAGDGHVVVRLGLVEVEGELQGAGIGLQEGLDVVLALLDGGLDGAEKGGLRLLLELLLEGLDGLLLGLDGLVELVDVGLLGVDLLLLGLDLFDLGVQCGGRLLGRRLLDAFLHRFDLFGSHGFGGGVRGLIVLLFAALGLGADDLRLGIGRDQDGAHFVDLDFVEDADLVVVAVAVLEMALVDAVADGELGDGSGLQEDGGVLAGGGGEDVHLDPHAVVVDALVGDLADDRGAVVGPAEAHVLGLLAGEPLVAGPRHDDVTHAVDVAEGEPVGLDVQEDAFRKVLGLRLDPCVHVLRLDGLGAALELDALHFVRDCLVHGQK